MAEDETATLRFHRLSSTQSAKSLEREGVEKSPFHYGVNEPNKQNQGSLTVSAIRLACCAGADLWVDGSH